MLLEVLPVLGDNYAYLVACPETGLAAAIDPVDAQAVERAVQELGWRLIEIWNTHHHRDHTGGNQQLLRDRPLTVLGHRLDGDRIPGLSRSLEHGETLALGNLQATVLHTPGHTRGSVCYRVGDALFTGDTLFVAGCGRLFEGEALTLFCSLNETIRALPPGLRIFSGHEYAEKNLQFARTVEPHNPARESFAKRAGAQRAAGLPVRSTLADELAINPFLRCDQDQLARALDLPLPAQPAAVFAHLRQRRNTF